jgi:DNA-binding MarR family transcriptional regulator
VNLRQVFDDLVRLETELWNSLDARLVEECGVTLGAFNALLVVSETADCRVNDLAAALAITVGGASQAVDRFEARGLLARRPNPANRRSSLLALTDAGRAALDGSSGIVDDELRIWFEEPLSESAGRRFARDLVVLREAAARRRSARQSPEGAG